MLPRFRTILFLTFAAFFAAALAVPHAQAGEPAELGLGVRHQDEVWMVSTRHIGCNMKAPLDFYRLGSTCWNSVEADQLRGSLARGSEIVFYVHGNRMSFQEAADRGRLYYEELAAAGGPPIQFIIWSWPSEQIKGPIRDVRVKALRADFEGVLFADFLADLPPRSPVSAIGYSYGARVISGGLVEAAHFSSPIPTVSTVFLAPAVDVNWLGPGQLQGDAWLATNRMMVLFNTCDPALRRFRFTDACYQPAALGYTGPWWSGQTAGEVDAENVCCIVGKSHSELRYLGSTYLMNRLRGFLSTPFALSPNVNALADQH